MSRSEAPQGSEAVAKGDEPSDLECWDVPAAEYPTRPFWEERSLELEDRGGQNQGAAAPVEEILH